MVTPFQLDHFQLPAIDFLPTMPCLCQGLCGAAFGAPGPGDHKGEYLETDFVVINHEVRQVFGQVLEGGDQWTDPSWRVFFCSESTCHWLKYPTGMG